jgi:hypothetical protein
MGNIVVSVYDDKGDIIPNVVQAYKRTCFTHTSSAIKFVDFGKSSFFLPEEEDNEHVSQGVPGRSYGAEGLLAIRRLGSADAGLPTG